MEIKIDKLSYGGAGIGRVDGKVVFVEGGVPGDVLDIKIVQDKKSFSRAVIESVIQESEFRTEPECIYFPRCGGCDWQNVVYQKQLSEKKEIVADSLRRIGKLKDVEIDEITASTKEYGYRDRVLLTVFKEEDEYKIGFFEENSDRNVPIGSCSVASPAINEVIMHIESYFKEQKGLFLPFDKIYLLSRERKIAISFLGTQKNHTERMEDTVQEIVDYIEGKLDDTELSHEIEFNLMGLKFISAPHIFNQANLDINEIIIETIAGWLKPVERFSLLDLYCGIGNFSITLSKLFETVIGVDSNRDSIKYANRNLKANGISNTQFVLSDCRRYLVDYKDQPDVLIVDPPRIGVKNLIGNILRIRPKYLVYISCNPTTFARDTAELTKSHYRLNKISTFDMFPQTYHIELASLFELV